MPCESSIRPPFTICDAPLLDGGCCRPYLIVLWLGEMRSRLSRQFCLCFTRQWRHDRQQFLIADDNAVKGGGHASPEVLGLCVALLPGTWFCWGHPSSKT